MIVYKYGIWQKGNYTIKLGNWLVVSLKDRKFPGMLKPISRMVKFVMVCKYAE